MPRTKTTARPPLYHTPLHKSEIRCVLYFDGKLCVFLPDVLQFIFPTHSGVRTQLYMNIGKAFPTNLSDRKFELSQLKTAIEQCCPSRYRSYLKTITWRALADKIRSSVVESIALVSPNRNEKVWQTSLETSLAKFGSE